MSLLVVMGVREAGQKVMLAIKRMGGESSEAWCTVLDDLIKRGLRRLEFVLVDGAPGLDKAIAVVWEGVPVQRCTVRKHRNLLAHAPDRLREEITNDHNDMIYAAMPKEIVTRRKAFLHKWRRLPPSPSKSARTTNAIARLRTRPKCRIYAPTAAISDKPSHGTFITHESRPEARIRAADRQRSLRSWRMLGASSKEVVMLRKAMVVLAVTLVLGGSALSSSAFARSGGYGGGGLGGRSFRSDHFAGAFGDGRTVGEGYGGFSGRVSRLRGSFHRYRRDDVWGHWGAYYGPMISIP